MPSGDHTTLTAVAAPTVIAIGCPPELNARCTRALAATGVRLEDCEVSNAVTMVAERQPLVIVLVEDLYAFDPDEFDALARDVRASLLRVEEDIVEAKLEMLLSAAIDATIERRKGDGVVVLSPPPAVVLGRTEVRRKRGRTGDSEAAPLSEGPQS